MWSPAAGSSANWITRFRSNSRPIFRLFCFPHAGGGSSAFAPLRRIAKGYIDVCAIRAPGRETRIAEPTVSDIHEAVECLVSAIQTYEDMPFALFGDCSGAILAFEVTRALVRDGRSQPQRLFVASCPAPKYARLLQSTSDLPRQEFMRRVEELQGIPPGILDSSEMTELIEPALRADLKMLEEYVYRSSPPFDLPISAFRGKLDRTLEPEEFNAWQLETYGEFCVHEFDAAHFLMSECAAAVVTSIELDLGIRKGY